ncbi:vacuolar-sorting protein SNF7, putative [Hepatocystis sp. ex Piliocolobus tephrosceles]|uniref:Charged multivesicular body protein 5 n=1 Tax=Piliocolobus tephrosceles TaxID=591936 RepID=A0A8C9HL31_9PRIM|nr:vacuolar-sorting protein SNF7, putative [Hepatocystis sp. ex Piliocolobus tephrosceles]
MKFFKKKKGKTLDEAHEHLGKSLKGIDENIDRYNKELNVIKQKIEEEKNKKPVNQYVIESLRKKAAILIKRKKVYEDNKDNTLGIQFNIDQVKFASDNIKMSIDTCETLKNSAKVLKKNMKKVNINKMEKLQDDLFDIIEDTKEISEILSSSYNIPEEMNEHEIDAELSLIEDTIMDEEAVEEDITSYIKKEDETNVNKEVEPVNEQPIEKENSVKEEKKVKFAEKPKINVVADRTS